MIKQIGTNIQMKQACEEVELKSEKSLSGLCDSQTGMGRGILAIWYNLQLL